MCPRPMKLIDMLVVCYLNQMNQSKIEINNTLNNDMHAITKSLNSTQNKENANSFYALINNPP